MYRKSVWSKNVDFISSHNEEYTNGLHDFAVGENEFADMTTDEITSYFNGLDTEEISQSGEKFHSDVSVKSLPSEIDWRKNVSRFLLKETTNSYFRVQSHLLRISYVAALAGLSAQLDP